MDEYISREAAIAEFSTCGAVFTYGRKSCEAIISRLKLVPAADVRPVVRARWNRYVHDKELWANYCSACNTYLPPGMDWEPNFCPNCGADMREETEEADK